MHCSATHNHLEELARGLASCVGPAAASIQDAASCFLFGFSHAAQERQPQLISGNTCEQGAQYRRRSGDDHDSSAALSIQPLLEEYAEPGGASSSSQHAKAAAGLHKRPLRADMKGAHSSAVQSAADMGKSGKRATAASAHPFWLTFKAWLWSKTLHTGSICKSRWCAHDLSCPCVCCIHPHVLEAVPAGGAASFQNIWGVALKPPGHPNASMYHQLLSSNIECTVSMQMTCTLLCRLTTCT